MKLYNLVELMEKVNELIQIIGADKIKRTHVVCEKEESEVYIHYVDSNKNSMYVQYAYEVDEDEDDGYYKLCRVIRNGERIERGSLEELIELVRKYCK